MINRATMCPRKDEQPDNVLHPAWQLEENSRVLRARDHFDGSRLIKRSREELESGRPTEGARASDWNIQNLKFRGPSAHLPHRRLWAYCRMLRTLFEDCSESEWTYLPLSVCRKTSQLNVGQSPKGTINELRQIIVRARLRKPFSNMEHKAPHIPGKDKNIIILPMDKGQMMVLLNTTDHIEKAKQQLNDTTTRRLVDTDPSAKLE